MVFSGLSRRLNPADTAFSSDTVELLTAAMLATAGAAPDERVLDLGTRLAAA
jgi:methylase of polypeptide subunit release factors